MKRTRSASSLAQAAIPKRQKAPSLAPAPTPAPASLAALLLGEAQRGFSALADPVYARSIGGYMRNKFEFYGIKTEQRRAEQRLILKRANAERLTRDSLVEVVKLFWGQPQRDFQYFAQELLQEHLEPLFLAGEKTAREEEKGKEGMEGKGKEEEEEPKRGRGRPRKSPSPLGKPFPSPASSSAADVGPPAPPALGELVGLVEHLVTNKPWWDTIDVIAAHIAGRMLRRRTAEALGVLDRWIGGEDFWLRRVAILHQLRYKHETDHEMLFSFCLKAGFPDEFFVQKSVGWALREYAKTDPKAVRRFLERHREVLSKLAMREAAKHLQGK